MNKKIRTTLGLCLFILVIASLLSVLVSAQSINNKDMIGENISHAPINFSSLDLVERKQNSDIYYNASENNYVMKLYPRSVNMKDLNGEYKPYEEITSLEYNDGSLDIKWNNKSVKLEIYTIDNNVKKKFKEKSKKEKEDLSLKTSVFKKRGGYYYNHTLNKVKQPSKLGYNVVANNVTCYAEDYSLVCDEQRIDFEDAVVLQNLSVVVSDSKIEFSGEDLSYIDPSITLDGGDLWRNGELEADLNCIEECDRYYFREDDNSFWIGRFDDLNYVYRSYITWDISDIETSWDITNIDLYWWTSIMWGSDNTAYFYEMIQTDADWLPSDQGEMDELYNAIGARNIYEIDPSPVEGEWNTAYFTSAAESRMELDKDNNYRFIVGIRGEEAYDETKIDIDGIGSLHEPYLVITYTDTEQADLEILNVIPVQVIPDVDMVKGKSGYVRVIVRNNGPYNATALVNIEYEGVQLPIYDNSTKFIANGENKTFDFKFKPMNAGTNKTISATVWVVE